MMSKTKRIHPYIPNLVPEVSAKMLEEIGVKDIDALYADIPEHLRFKGKMNLPQPLTSEYAGKRQFSGRRMLATLCAGYL